MSLLRLRLRLHARRSYSTSHPPRSQGWDPHAAFAAATERARSGNLTSEDAHKLFDQLLLQANPVNMRLPNDLLTALARAPAFAACSNGPALAVALFSRLSQGARQRVVQPTACTHGILMDCCCNAHRLDLALAFFARLLRTGLKAGVIEVNTLLKGLCRAKRAHEALDILLHRMPELGCTPNVVAYTTVIHGFFKEGQVSKACNLFHEMALQGVTPDVVTYNSVIDALCKARAMDKAEYFLGQMVDDGVVPDNVTYNSLIHGYSFSGHWKEAVRVFKQMTSRRVTADVHTYNMFMTFLCKHGRSKEAAGIFDTMAIKGLKPDNVSYAILLHGYATEGCLVDMINLFNSMERDCILPDCRIFNILINAYAKSGKLDKAMLIFNEMQKQGVSPNAVTYSTVIDAFCKKGQLDDAMIKFNQMIDTGIRQGTTVYGFCTHGDLVKAKELLTEMMNKGIPPPDIKFFHSIMQNLGTEGRVIEARDVLGLIAHIGMRPNVCTFNILSGGYCLSARWRMPQKYLMI
uniref:Restorer of fertility-like protein n=1 Tax=Triticum aestivum TaxID=4565 RepID=A0A7S5S107_WHEAT|nr:restorer of fertility-like protein [Triticum aestivum]